MSLSLTYNQIVLSPHITEKSVRASARDGERAYTFKVHPSANKKEIGKAVQMAYKVSPVRINVVKVPGKTVNRSGRKGKKSGYKKALVYLKKGDTIQFV